MYEKYFNLSTLDGMNGFVVPGSGVGTELGWRVSLIGDVNDDRIDDFVLGAPSVDTNGQGVGYVVFGRK